MAQLFNNQPIRGVVVVEDGTTIYNNQPVLGVRTVAEGVLFSEMRRTIGVEVVEDGDLIHNDWPVLGVVEVTDGSTLYNGWPVEPVFGLSVPIASMLTDPRLVMPFNDVSRMYQDSAGTTPMSADPWGEQVGLVLDERAEPGPGLSIQSIDAAWEDNFDGTYSAGGGLTGNIKYSVAAGVAYLCTVTVESISTGTVRFSRDLNGPDIKTAGTYSYVLTSSGNAGEGWMQSLSSDAVISGLSIRELPGTHLHQPTPADRPVLGRHPFGGRRNLLTYTEEFDNSFWSKTNCVVTADDTTGPFGEVTGDRLTISSDGVSRLRVDTQQDVSTEYTLSFFVKAGTAPYIYARNVALGSAPNVDGVWWDASDFSVSSVGSRVTAAGSYPVGDGWQLCWMTATIPDSIANNLVDLGVSDVANQTSALAGQTAYFFGAQLEESGSVTDYQKVVSEYDVTEAGKADCIYLRGNGINQCMETSAPLDLSDTDQVTAFVAAFRETTATGILFELSPSPSAVDGSLSALLYTLERVRFSSRGTVAVNADTGSDAAEAGAAYVIAMTGDISGDEAVVRVDGVESGSNTGDQGTGNYANDILHVMARNGANIFLSGNLYGLAIDGVVELPAQMEAIERRMARLEGKTI